MSSAAPAPPPPAPDDFSLHAAGARDSLLVYAQLQARKYTPGRMHAYIGLHLEAVESGAIKRLMVFTPPRHGKTTLLSFLIAWCAGRHPDWNVVFASFSKERASDVSIKVRQLISSPVHAGVFPGRGLGPGSATMHRMTLAAGGTFYAVGVGSALTGRGADLLIIDDPVKDAEEAQSEATQKSTFDWWTSVAVTRLSPAGRVVLVMTRWNERDLAGSILSGESAADWRVLNLPALAEAGDPLRRNEGDALWPEFFSRDVLQRVRSEVSSRTWAALYQQRPAPLEGGIWKRAWVKHYLVPPDGIHETIITADLAFKGDQTSDFVALHVWGRVDSAAYLLDRVHDRMDFPTTLQAFRSLCARWPSASAKYVEDKANGPALIQSLSREIPGIIPIDPSEIGGDKAARVAAVSPFGEAGNVWFPDHTVAPWVGGFVEELVTFPNAAYNDDVDAMVYGLWKLLRGVGPGANVLEFYRLRLQERVRSNQGASRAN